MQKRKIIALVGLLLFAAGYAQAASTATIAAGAGYSGQKTGNTTTQLGKLSNNVSAVITYDNTSYAVNTHHLNGTKEYGSSAGDTKIFSKDLAAGTSVPESPASNDSTSYTATTWSSL